VKQKIRFCPLILLIIPSLAFGLGFRFRNTFENWTWQDTAKTIFENNFSTRFSAPYVNAGLEILLRIDEQDSMQACYKKDVSVNLPWLSLMWGDFYYSLGQGLMLGLEPDELIERDRYLEGARLEVNSPWLKLSGIWGTPWNIDRYQKDYRIINDTSDVIFGFDVATKMLGGRTLWLMMDDKYTTLFGADVEFSNDLFWWYLEMVQKLGWDRIAYEEQSGKGIYSNLSAVLASYVLDFEFLYCDELAIGDISYRYNLLPTGNPGGYSINQGRDEIGLQLGVSKSVGSIWLNFSHSFIQTAKGGRKILTDYLTLEFTDLTFLLKRIVLDSVDIHFAKREELEAEISSSYQFSHYHVVDSYLLMRRVDTKDLWFLDIGTGVANTVGFLTLYADYLWRSKEVLQESLDREWLGAGLKIELADKLFLDVWKGKEKGGLICSGGICRYVAPFDGYKIKLTLSL